MKKVYIALSMIIVANLTFSFNKRKRIATDSAHKTSYTQNEWDDLSLEKKALICGIDPDDINTERDLLHYGGCSIPKFTINDQINAINTQDINIPDIFRIQDDA